MWWKWNSLQWEPNIIDHLYGGTRVWKWEILKLLFFPFCVFATFDLEF